MTSNEIRERFLKFFEKRGHKIIPSASLVTSEEKGITDSTLFNTAGMQPLIPYFFGKKHPAGTRLVDSQKCVRTVDINSVGDSTHLTFFEMLGNWSLGDYFKEDAIKWSYELLTSLEEGFGLDPKRLYITVFEGNENVSRDEEVAKIWQNLGISKSRVYYMSADSNWWQAGDNGPCGPDTEMFYDITEEGLGDLTKEEFIKADAEQKVVEIWNDVFMEYEKKNGKLWGKLPNKNVDTGSGLERLAMILQKKNNVFETDLFTPIINKINEFTNGNNLNAKRIVADHIKASFFLIADGVEPEKTGRGYVLRRLIRRARYYFDSIGGQERSLIILVEPVVEIYKNTDYDLSQNINKIEAIIKAEENIFARTLASGKKYLEKIIFQKGNDISGEDVFLAESTYGYPLELSLDILKKNNIKIDTKLIVDQYSKKQKKHQELSRKGAEQKFKGGLADSNPTVIKYHTATHLLHRALRDVLGDHVSQKGSNITAERLRFDFTHNEKMTDGQKQEVEKIVNQKIQEALPVQNIILPKEKAEKTGALHFFADKYGDQVSIYFIGGDLNSAYSKEFCGGPHVKNTSELNGMFKITKEGSVAQGVRRIKAVLV